MARKKARSFFKQCKDYVRGITRARKKKLLEKLSEKEQKKVQMNVYFEDKPLKKIKTEKHNSEENKPEEVFVDKPLKELERQDETEKRNSKKEFVENELKNQENKPEGQIQLWCKHCNYSYCKCRPSY
ncbi:hypothetical protein C1646_662333 [Rhizophagus diaphanus]|nr:hypothetical protein C1646_662333 [Rhizophagus diaphanus] [Rhizophagus sp. MUCL 43196]